MVRVIGVRFKTAGKIYYFDPEDLEINVDDFVVVETVRGIEYGKVAIGIKEISEEEIISPLKKVIRVATEEDKLHAIENKKQEKEAFSICLKKISEHNLEMKLIDVEYTFDNNKILFYFTADGRIDFRELVKDLASVFRTRIELRQIGVRDEAKMMGGIGICGRVLCCKQFLGDFHPVSIKMAKEQGLSLNPTKISGACGRLMCCLKYEQEAYEDINKHIPKQGAIVKTPDGQGLVVHVSVLKELVKVKLDKGTETDIRVYKTNDIKVIKDVFQSEDSEDVDLELLKQLED